MEVRSEEVVEKIKYEDKLRQGTDKLNQSIEQSNLSFTKSERAEVLSEAAKLLAESVQEQFNQVVIAGDSSVEAAQARVDAKNQTYPTLKSRIDSFEVSATQQLQQIAMHIKDFGAVGDGVTDDYEAFKAAETYFNSIGTGRLILDPVNYYIGRYRVTGGENQNDVEHIYFQNVNGFRIEGNGATITIKGDIHRSHDYDAYGYKYSYVQALSIYFETCDDLTVRDLTVDGQVHLMTRDTGVMEGGGYGIRWNGCRNINFENVHSKRVSMDGFALMPSNALFNGIRRICRNIRMIGCTGLYNSRQGLTAGHFVNLYIENCDFSFTGKAGGSYGRTSPGMGIDFEMDYDISEVEEQSRGAVIKDSRLIGNYNTVSIFNSRWRDITFINCEMENDYVGSLNDINLNGVNIKMIDCYINILGNILMANPSQLTTDVTFKGNNIKCHRLAVFESVNLAVMLIGNIINGEVYINVANKKSFAERNVFIADEADKTGTTYMMRWRLKYLSYSRDNTFLTDLAAAGSFFNADYANTDIVANDLYTNNNVRPSWNSASGIRAFNKGLS